ncbi:MULTISPECIES: squalene--hopene cyclase [Actinoalloteichus]|uniref:Squalene-hopene cyclase n=1 Tax=Actinoalloteichus fjordicus TaxID=1612552 RepID=A0AAC9LBA9_9PSEU|nr:MULTISPECIES: squalene--hopene cyclase [Actinoalloteichus]APU14608.1 squalene-hopene cyclase [Actinoalloteichus fjordicus]APU20576.1 squalene-hopene cyclase [Actinoalloteichus sp. GBA129-24]
MTKVDDALAQAVDWLLKQQDSEGYWYAPVLTNVTAEAGELFMHEFLGTRTEEYTTTTARWIRSQQRADGTWATFPGGPAELSVTIEAYLALRLAGDRPDEPHMAAAAAFCREAGGAERSRMVTRIWLAILGQWSWDELPVIPPELMFVPRESSMSVYGFSGWTRMAVIPLTLISSHRPTVTLPFDVDELRSEQPVPPPADPPLLSWPGMFVRMDRLLHRYERRPVARVRRTAARLAEQWMMRHQEVDGSWLGIHLITVFGLLGLGAAGYRADHPTMVAGLRGLSRFAVTEQTPQGVARRVACCPGPVWDTALVVLALLDSGTDPADDRVRAAAEWLLDREIRTKGDWAVNRPDLVPGAWSFPFAMEHFPDCDDTSLVVLALHRVAEADGSPIAERAAAAADRGFGWLFGQQSENGGWAVYDADKTSDILAQLPFCDFGVATDPPSVDITAHVVEAFARILPPDDPRMRNGALYLLKTQEEDGSWFGRWGANYVYGTGAAVPALIAAGASPQSRAVRRAVRWLVDHQNADGGWGEDLRSYDDDSWRGRGESTPSQTAWALLALHAAGEGEDTDVVRRGIEWLTSRQLPDGTWEEHLFTGTGFPGDFYIGYPLYRQIFPIMALGRYRRQPVTGSPASVAAESSKTISR